MEENKMRSVSLSGRTYTVSDGTPYVEIARRAQSDYPDDILLLRSGSRLVELCSRVDRDIELEALTARDKPGLETYERSAVLLLLRAFYGVAGKENVERVSVDFSISGNLYLRAKGSFTLNEKLLAAVEAEMRRLAEADLPIAKSTLPVEDAIALFEAEGMPEKARLLKYRISSSVNIYTLDGFADYFYGYMVPSTGYLRCFALQTFEGGFVLRLPSQEDPKQLNWFDPSYKVFREMYETTLLTEKIGISHVASLNDLVAEGRAEHLILAQEAQMEKKIGDAAEKIASRRDIRFVMIAGPSSSGKTTFSNRLSAQLRACGLIPHPIATDNYFKNRDDTPRDAKGNYNFESLEAMDVAQFNEDMSRLLKGETVQMPTYNFKKGMREYTGETLTLGSQDVLVIEGIHCLNDKFSYALPKESKFRIYISCLTTLNVDDHNRIHTTDTRLLRRIERDARTRGYSAQATIKMWPNVRAGEEGNIFPYQDTADLVFNSSLIYETSLLKTYVEPLLFNIPHDAPEYTEAKRLLKFLSYFMPVPAEIVPLTSLTREFVGGGFYKG